jgi:hypothetical protein
MLVRYNLDRHDVSSFGEKDFEFSFTGLGREVGNVNLLIHRSSLILLSKLGDNSTTFWKTPICFVSLILRHVKHGAGLLRRTSEYASLLRIFGPCIWAFLSYPRRINFECSLLKLSHWLKHSMHNSFLPFGGGTCVTTSFPQPEHKIL